MYRKVRNSNALLKQEKIQLAELEERNKKIDKEIKYEESETGKEDHFRREFNLALSGETVIVVLDEEKKEEDTTQKVGIWRRFLNLFNKQDKK